MFAHSLWSYSPLSFGQVRELVLHQYGESELSVYDASGSWSVSWIEPEGDARDASAGQVVIARGHRIEVHVLDARPVRGPDGTIIGVVSHLPALNSDLMDDLQAVTEARVLVPILRPERVASLPVYEARVVTDEFERSITYTAGPKRAAELFRRDWSNEVFLQAATIKLDQLGVLATVFADGQVWLEGAEFEMVPEVIRSAIARLWFDG